MSNELDTGHINNNGEQLLHAALLPK